MRVGWWVAVVSLVLAPTLVPAVSSVPWLMAHNDSARTGRTLDPGPDRFDIAASLELPYLRHYDSALVAFDGAVFATAASYQTRIPTGDEGVWRTDLETLETRRIVNLTGEGGYVSGLVSDGQRIFVASRTSVQAYDPADGRPLWNQPAALPVPQGTPTDGFACVPGLVQDGVVYMACTVYGKLADDEPDAIYSGGFPGLSAVALDAATGAALWRWTYDPAPAGELPNGVVFASRAERMALSHGVLAILASESTHKTDSCTGDPLATEYTSRNGLNPLVLHGINATTRADLWTVSATPALSTTAPTQVWDFLRRNEPVTAGSGYLTGTPNGLAAIVRGAVREMDAETGCVLREVELPNPDPDAAPDAVESGEDVVAVFGTHAIVSTFFGLGRINLDSLEALWWIPRIPGDGYVAASSGIAMTPTRLFVVDDQGIARALDLEDGGSLWRASLNTGTRMPAYAIADRMFIVAEGNRHLTVVGATNVSIGLDVKVASLYVEPGEPVRVDVSGTVPGLQDDRTEFAVDWGDLTADGWTDAMFFAHHYRLNGTYDLVVRARNDAGQTSSREVVVTVGGPPPTVGLENNDGSGTLANDGRSPSVVITVASVAVGGTVLLAGAAAVGLMVARSRTGSRDERAYRNIVAARLGAGVETGDDPVLRTVRRELGISDRAHAAIEASLLASGGGDPLASAGDGGLVLGRYDRLAPIAEGGMAVTYSARDMELDRPVVIKVIRAGAPAAKVVLREARAMAKIDHPRVVSIFDVERIGDDVWIMMSYLPGGSLKSRLENAPLKGHGFVRLARDVLEGVVAVHGAGFVHGDVKPSNILLDAEGRAKLADFGVARNANDATATSLAAPGTMAYLSPEQARGGEADERSDLFAAGLTLFEALTGRAYFARSGGPDFQLQLRIASAGPFDEALEGSEFLHGWFARMLAPSPGDRFQSAKEALRALGRLVEESRTKDDAWYLRA